MVREKQTNIRLTAEELLQVQVAAAALEMRPASLMRMFIQNGLKNFDMHREGVIAKLDVLQLQLERHEALLETIAKDADSAFLMSSAAVGFCPKVISPRWMIGMLSCISAALCRICARALKLGGCSRPLMRRQNSIKAGGVSLSRLHQC